MVPVKRAILMMVAVVAFAALPVFADSFTSSSAFNTAISGMSDIQTANFDSDPTGNIAEGATVDGITFNYTVYGGLDSLAIQSGFYTTSMPNYLGSNDPTTGALFQGDTITMSFASPVNAVGLFIIGGPYDDGDFTLASSTATGTSSSVLEETLPDFGEVIFLGITSTTGFSSATITANSDLLAGELWDVDDITTAVGTPGSGGSGPTPTPEPGTLPLLAAGLGILCALGAGKMRSTQAALLS